MHTAERLGLVAFCIMPILPSSLSAQKHRSTEVGPDESLEIETVASTYRVGKTQYVNAVISVRTLAHRDEEIAFDTEDCQISAPVRKSLGVKGPIAPRAALATPSTSAARPPRSRCAAGAEPPPKELVS